VFPGQESCRFRRVATQSSVREPRWYGIPVRVVLITFLLTLLSFAVSLFVGIIGTILLAKIRGGAPDLATAYRKVAFPVAMVVAAVVFVSSLVLEIRHYRQNRALAKLEKIADC
jgi:hypothetical protein